MMLVSTGVLVGLHFDTWKNAWTKSHENMSRIVIFGAIVTEFELVISKA